MTVPIVFAGPSLHGVPKNFAALSIRPPAALGDIATAVLEGAPTIGLIDGLFGDTAAVWHKEILFALHAGVRVLGASSMGALRAAECALFGMEPVGKIAALYCSGALDDDAAVALVHGPDELDFMPLSLPLVDFWATLKRLRALGHVSQDEEQLLNRGASQLFFKERSLYSVPVASGLPADRRQILALLYRDFEVHQKRQDALELIDRMLQRPTTPHSRPFGSPIARSPGPGSCKLCVNEAGNHASITQVTL